MIGRLRGLVIEKRPTALLVDVGGVGYETSIPVSTYERLPGIGEEVTLVTHTHVREDALIIFAFATADERSMFRHLIGVSGVGPKLGLAVLSGLSVDDFRETIAAGDARRLQGVPGIGKRTAERLVVELRDRVGVGETNREGANEARALGCAPDVYGDAVSALAALGFTDTSAAAAVRKVLPSLEDPSLEELVKASLVVSQR